MTCHTLKDEAGQPIGVYCTRERKRRCYSCSAPNASLSCDGCDHVLCTACAVSPRQGLDYCPNCARPAWLFFWQTARPEGDRAARRNAFRHWARENPFVFMQHANERTTRSLAEVGVVTVDAPATVDPAGDDVLTPHELWLAANKDASRYRELLIEHGHLVPKERR